MADQREVGMVEVEKRCRALFNILSLKNVLRLPDNGVDEKDMPCVLIMEGDDVIEAPSSRNFLGYPCQRVLDVIVECWDFTSGDVRNICREVREAILENKGVLATGVAIREKKTIGPFNFDIPNVRGFRIVFNLVYKDNGPDFN